MKVILASLSIWILASSSIANATTYYAAGALCYTGNNGSVEANLLGTPQGALNALQCNLAQDENATNGAGWVGKSELVLCHLKKDLGITGATSLTGEMDGPASICTTQPHFKAHVEVSAPTNGVTINSTTYDAQAKIWACHCAAKPCTATECTAASDFTPVGFLAWSKDSGGGSKGHYEVDYGVAEYINSSTHQCGFDPGAFVLTIDWDLSSSLSTQTVTVLSPGASGRYGTLQRNASTGDLAFTLIYPGTYGYRVSGTWTKNGTGQIYSEGANIGGGAQTFIPMTNPGTNSSPSGMASAKSDTPSTNCYNYTWTDDSGADQSKGRTYTDGASATCAVPAFPNKSMNDVNSLTESDTAPNLSAMSAPSGI